MALNINLLGSARADNLGVRRFASAMRRKLSKKRREGRRGWNVPMECSQERLAVLLAEHVRKGDPVDIANLAMMIWNRQHPFGVRRKKR